MQTKQLGTRHQPAVIERLKKCGDRTRLSDRAIVELALEITLPLLESGVYGTPAWERLKAQWDEDLEQVKREFEAVARGIGRSPGAKKAAA
jgi:hypothetical protein